MLVASQIGTLAAWLLFLLALSLPRVDLVELGGATWSVPLLLILVARALDGATGGSISVATALVADLTRAHPQTGELAFGRMGMAASLGFVIGPAAAGLLGGTAWGPRLPIALAALLAGATTVAILLLLKETGVSAHGQRKRAAGNGPPLFPFRIATTSGLGPEPGGVAHEDVAAEVDAKRLGQQEWAEATRNRRRNGQADLRVAAPGRHRELHDTR